MTLGPSVKGPRCASVVKGCTSEKRGTLSVKRAYVYNYCQVQNEMFIKCWINCQVHCMSGGKDGTVLDCQREDPVGKSL